MTKVCIFGCKETTRHLIRRFNFAEVSAVVTIAPEKGAAQQVADYSDLRDLSDAYGRLHTAERYDLKSEVDLAFFQEQQFDLGFVAGWQRLVPNDVLSTFKTGVFGMHGSSQDLPFGRGRSPMNWSLIEGRQWFFTNLFKYEPGVDDGPVLDTACFSIQPQDTAETLHFKNLSAMVSLIEKNWPVLESSQLQLVEQGAGEPTYYPKRTPADSQIDWSDTIFNIEKLIRAVAPPFSGAFTHFDEQALRINRAGVFYTDVEGHPFTKRRAGEICDIFPNGKFLVRCNGGVLIVHDFDLGGAGALKQGDVLSTADTEIKKFARNKHGYFDLPE